jgi:lipoprotein-releasing system ATP-binding protein
VTLAVEQLTFGYSGGATVIDHLTLSLEPGKVTAITGPSGCGKSTLLALLGLLLSPRSGDVVLEGSTTRDRSDRHRSNLRAVSYGFVFQDACLDPARSVLDNVLEPVVYAGRSANGRRAQAMDLLRRTDIDLAAGRRPGEVSGGQAQRIALCRALINDPTVILADEPTGNLDLASGSIVLDLLAAAAADGRTVVIATHDGQVVDRCDSVVEL